jgi:hypothetical protein
MPSDDAACVSSALAGLTEEIERSKTVLGSQLGGLQIQVSKLVNAMEVYSRSTDAMACRMYWLTWALVGAALMTAAGTVVLALK